MNNPKFLFFGDDWGRHPSSSQHLTKCLLPNHQVTWVNTIGMRPPRFDKVTFKRGVEKCKVWYSGDRTNNITDDISAPNLTIIDSKMWPWMSHRWDRWINSKLLTTQLRKDSKNKVVITTIPIVADLVDELEAEKWIYYCVDDYSVWPGLDGRTHRQMEDRLITKVDKVIAVSDTLVGSISRRGREAELLTHGVDLAKWEFPSSQTEAITERIGSTEPLAIFWGVIDQRMDANWVISLADSLAEGYIILAGPVQNPDSRLLSHPRIKTIGAVSFDSLPQLATLANVLIMPYQDLAVTRAMQPLKLKEYLATLRPVVTSRLPSVMPWRECLEMTDHQDDFVAKVRHHLQSPKGTPSPFSETIRRKLACESWQAKSEAFLQMVMS